MATLSNDKINMSQTKMELPSFSFQLLEKYLHLGFSPMNANIVQLFTGCNAFLSIVISTKIGCGIRKHTIAQARARRQKIVNCISPKDWTLQATLIVCIDFVLRSDRTWGWKSRWERLFIQKPLKVYAIIVLELHMGYSFIVHKQGCESVSMYRYHENNCCCLHSL